MVFRKHDRKLFAGLEASGGSAATIDTTTDYIESSEPTFSITPLLFERTPKAGSMTKPVATVPGTGDLTPVATVEFGFGMELAGPSADVAAASNAPRIGTLLKACGLAETAALYSVGIGNVAGGPLLNREMATAGTGPAVFTDTFYDDGTLYCGEATALSSSAVVGEVSAATAVATGSTARVGVGYRFRTDRGDGGVGNSSATIRLYLDDNGSYVEGKGMRGTADFTFTHGDRVLVNFTFTGVLNSYVDGAGTDVTDYTYPTKVPPAFIAPSAGIQVSQTSSDVMSSTLIFNSMTLSLGNDVSVRENTNAADGYDQGIITGRTPTFGFNPDATRTNVVGNLDFWNSFLSGAIQRMSFTVGATVGNKIKFKMPAIQFTGITDGDRDSVMVLDSTCNMTGGNYGSSLLSNGATTKSNTDLGFDNELAIIFE